MKYIEDKYLPREAVIDELLCFGWIDGIRRHSAEAIERSNHAANLTAKDSVLGQDL
jgi:hypothetical protein